MARVLAALTWSIRRAIKASTSSRLRSVRPARGSCVSRSSAGLSQKATLIFSLARTSSTFLCSFGWSLPYRARYARCSSALSVATDAKTVQSIAERAGWKCFDCNRGPFHVIEVWVENETMVEVLPPEYAAEYLAFARPDNFRKALAAAPVGTARQG